MSLLGLNNELILNVAEYLDERSLSHLLRTCYPLKRLLEHLLYQAAAKDIDGIAALIWAVKDSNLSLVTFLLNNGADIEISRRSKEIGWHPETALQQAAQLGDTVMVRFLLERGANIDAQGICSSKTALHFATAEGASETVRLLLKRGANTELLDIMSNTPLHIAAKGCVGKYGFRPARPSPPEAWSECVRLLLKYGSPIEGGTYLNPSETPLHIAVMFAQAPVVKLLLQKGANVNAQSKRGTPLELAQRCFSTPEFRYYGPALEITEVLVKYQKRHQRKISFLRLLSLA